VWGWVLLGLVGRLEVLTLFDLISGFGGANIVKQFTLNDLVLQKSPQTTAPIPSQPLFSLLTQPQSQSLHPKENPSHPLSTKKRPLSHQKFWPPLYSSLPYLSNHDQSIDESNNTMIIQ